MLCGCLFAAAGTGSSSPAADARGPIRCFSGPPSIRTHFDGVRYENPSWADSSEQPPVQAAQRGSSRWIWRWLWKDGWPEWPFLKNLPGHPPPSRIAGGEIRITAIGHATFLIQMDGVNILTDPVWSDRCGPLPWIGPQRHQAPGLRFGDIPALDAVLVSHNHYDHLDLPTLARLAAGIAFRAYTPPGNENLIREAGIREVRALDWWESAALSGQVTVTVVPAQHFSSRTLWDRDEALWGGFVISGPSGNVLFAGDTGYNRHFREIAERFDPIRAAILPIAPFRTPAPDEPPRDPRRSVHMGPAEAVEAHLDLRPELSLASHFQVFQLGPEGFADAAVALSAARERRGVPPGAFVAPVPGQAFRIRSAPARTPDRPLQVPSP